MAYRSALHIDLDDGIAEAHVRALVAFLREHGLAALVQRRDKLDGEIRARAIIPLVRTSNTPDFASRVRWFFKVVEHAIGCGLDRKTAVYSQHAYVYCRVPGRRAPYTVAVLDGLALDLTDAPAESHYSAAARARAVEDRPELAEAAYEAAEALLVAAGLDVCGGRCAVPEPLWPRPDYGDDPDVSIMEDGWIHCWRAKVTSAEIHRWLQEQAPKAFQAWQTARGAMRCAESAALVALATPQPTKGTPSHADAVRTSLATGEGLLSVVPPGGCKSHATRTVAGEIVKSHAADVFIATSTHGAAEGMTREGDQVVKGTHLTCTNDYVRESIELARLPVLTPGGYGACVTCADYQPCRERRGIAQVEADFKDHRAAVRLSTHAGLGEILSRKHAPMLPLVVVDEDPGGLVRVEITPREWKAARKLGPHEQVIAEAKGKPLKFDWVRSRLWNHPDAPHAWTGINKLIEVEGRDVHWSAGDGCVVGYYRNPLLDAAAAIQTATPDPITAHLFGADVTHVQAISDSSDVDRVFIQNASTGSKTFKSDRGRWLRAFEDFALPEIMKAKRPLVAVSTLAMREAIQPMLPSHVVDVIVMNQAEGRNEYRTCDAVIAFGTFRPPVEQAEIDAAGIDLTTYELSTIRGANQLAQIVGRLRVKSPGWLREEWGAPSKVRMTVIGAVQPTGWDREVVTTIGARPPQRPAKRLEGGGGTLALEMAIEACGSAARVANDTGVSRDAVSKWKKRGVPADRVSDLLITWLARADAA